MVVCSNRTRCYGQKLEHRKLHTNTRKNSVIVRVMEHQNRMPREVAEPLSLEILKTHLGTFLCDLLQEACFTESWATWSPELPSNLCVTYGCSCMQTPVKFYHPNSPTINPAARISAKWAPTLSNEMHLAGKTECTTCSTDLKSFVQLNVCKELY